MIQTLRQAARGLARRKSLTLLVIFIMALCIGGNTAIFSAAKAVLFQDLLYKDADRLVILTLVELSDGADNDLSWAETKDWARRTTLLEDLSPFLSWKDRTLTEGETVERIGVNFVPSSFFKLLGVKPQLGRLLSPEEDGAPDSAPVIVLGHDLWQRRFAGDPAIVGRKIQLNDLPYTVVGVMPKDFVDFIQGHFPVEAWIPAVQAGQTFPIGKQIYSLPNARYWFVLAHLKPGATFASAQNEVRAIGLRMQREFPDQNREFGAHIQPLRSFMFSHLYPGIKVLLAAALVVLLIGCANIANLLLVRQTERRRELALRLALGSGPWELAKHVLAESLILAVLGGALGLLLGVWGTRLLAEVVALPAYVQIRLDGGVLVAAIVATLLTGLLFALPSVWSVARMDSKGTLQRIGSLAGGRTYSSRSRNGLLVFQVAFVMVLLVVAGLLLRSFMELRSTGVGFATDRLLTVRMAFSSQHYTDTANIVRAQEEILRRVKTVPGVRGAAIWGPGIPAIDSKYFSLKPEGAPDSDPTVHAESHIVTPETLDVLEVPILRGRGFTAADAADKPRVAIVSRSLGEALWPGRDPIGKRLLRYQRDTVPWTVVGVIRDTRFQGRLYPGGVHLLLPQAQVPSNAETLLVKLGPGATQLEPVIQELIHKVDPQIPIFDFATLEQRLWKQEGGHRLNAVIVGVYSVLALILAVAGLYGMLAYSVVQRTKEIGLRMALGAEQPRVVGMFMRRALLLVAGGLALGLAGAIVLARLLSSLLFGIKATDPVTLLGASAVFVVISFLATYLPARRAAKVEPTIALRFE